MPLFRFINHPITDYSGYNRKLTACFNLVYSDWSKYGLELMLNFIGPGFKIAYLGSIPDDEGKHRRLISLVRNCWWGPKLSFRLFTVAIEFGSN